MSGMQDLLGAFGLASQESAQYAQQASELLGKQAKAGEDIALQTEQIGKLTTEALATKLGGELRAQEAARSVASSLGANPDDVENFKLGLLGQDFWNSYSQARQVQQTIVKKQSANFLDDPLTWLYNQVSVDGDIRQYNALAAQANMASDAMMTINANVQGTAAAQKAIAQTLTQDSIGKTLESTSLASKVEADKIRQQNLSYNLKALDVVHQASQEGLTRQFQLHGAMMSEANLAIKQEELSLQRQAAKERAEERSFALSQKKQNEEDTQRFVDVVNTARGVQGLPPMSRQEVRMASMTQAGKVKLEQFYTDGAVMLSTGRKVLGEDAGHAAATVMINQSPMNPAMKPVRDFAVGSLTDARKILLSPDSKEYNPKATAEDIMAKANTLIKERANAYHRDITKNPVGNPYLAPGTKQMGQIPDVASSNFYKVAVAPLAANGLVESDPDKLIASGMAAVQAGTLSFKDLQIGLAGYFKAAVNSNIASRNFQTMHVPVQGGYNVSVSNYGPFGSKDQIDISNPVHVGNYLMRLQLRNRLGANAAEPISTFGLPPAPKK